MTKSRKLAYLSLLGGTTIWAAAIPIVKPALDFVSPFQFLWLRFLVAAVVTFPLLAYLIAKQRMHLSTIIRIIPVELIFIFYVILVYLGLNQTSALQASFIMNTRPILVTLMGIIVLHEVEETHEWIGLILSVIGTGILLFTPLITGQSSLGDSSTIGNLLILAGIIMSTIYTYAVKIKYQDVPKIQVEGINAILGLVVFSLILYLFGSTPSSYQASTASVAFAALYMGILGTPIALGLRNYGFNLIEASEATLFTYLQPLIYIPLAVLWLGESLYSYQIIAMLIIFSGVLIAEYRPGKSNIYTRLKSNITSRH